MYWFLQNIFSCLLHIALDFLVYVAIDSVLISKALKSARTEKDRQTIWIVESLTLVLSCLVFLLTTSHKPYFLGLFALILIFCTQILQIPIVQRCCTYLKDTYDYLVMISDEAHVQPGSVGQMMVTQVNTQAQPNSMALKHLQWSRQAETVSMPPTMTVVGDQIVVTNGLGLKPNGRVVHNREDNHRTALLGGKQKLRNRFTVTNAPPNEMTTDVEMKDESQPPSVFVAPQFDIVRNIKSKIQAVLTTPPAQDSSDSWTEDTLSSLDGGPKRLNPPIGIVNTGNNCFIISILQCLARVDEIHTVLDQIRLLSGQYSTYEVTFIEQLRPILLELSNGRASGAPTSIYELRKALVALSTFTVQSDQKQQDAPEFLMELLTSLSHLTREAPNHSAIRDLKVKMKYLDEQLSEETKVTLEPRNPLNKLLKEFADTKYRYEQTRHPSRLKTLFFGQQLQLSECQKCSYFGAQTQQFTTIMIPIRSGYDRRCATSIQDSVSNLTRPEACNLKLECPCKGMHIIRTPPLKARKPLKESTPKTPPLNNGSPNLSAFLSPISDKVNVIYERSQTQTIRTIISHPPRYLCVHLKRFTNLNGSLEKNHYPHEINLRLDVPTMSGSRCYNLFAVVVHMGNMTVGHYFAICKHLDGKWYILDDCNSNLVNDISSELKGTKVQENAYLAFYKIV